MTTNTVPSNRMMSIATYVAWGLIIGAAHLAQLFLGVSAVAVVAYVGLLYALRVAGAVRLMQRAMTDTADAEVQS